MDKIEVGKRIKAFMKEKGLTQNDVADVFGLTQSNVSEMASGKRDSLRLAELIADYYGISLDKLIYGKDNISTQDINISDIDNISGIAKYTNELLILLKEYINNERTIQDLANRNRQLLNQMMILDGLKKGEESL